MNEIQSRPQRELPTSPAWSWEEALEAIATGRTQSIKPSARVVLADARMNVHTQAAAQSESDDDKRVQRDWADFWEKIKQEAQEELSAESSANSKDQEHKKRSGASSAREIVNLRAENEALQSRISAITSEHERTAEKDRSTIASLRARIVELESGSELTALRADLNIACTERDAALRNVHLLESFTQLSGIELKNVVPPSQGVAGIEAPKTKNRIIQLVRDGQPVSPGESAAAPRP